jgi:hypothetical protein
MTNHLTVNLTDDNVRYDVKNNTIYVTYEGSYPELLTVVGKKSKVDFKIDIELAISCEFWDGEYTVMKPVDPTNVLKPGVKVVLGYCV